MAFENETAPAFANEKSEFLCAVRDRLAGFVLVDKWTVDRANNMVLVLTGRGTDIDSQNEEYWNFFQENHKYRFMTKLLESREVSKGKIFMRRNIRFHAGEGLSEPNEAATRLIKQALVVRKDFGVLSKYESCELILITATGEVL